MWDRMNTHGKKTLSLINLTLQHDQEVAKASYERKCAVLNDKGWLNDCGNYALCSSSSQCGSLLTGTTQCTVQSGTGPGRYCALCYLSDQAGRLTPRTTQFAIGASPVQTLHNSRSQGRGLEMPYCAVHASECETKKGEPISVHGECENRNI